MATIKKMVAYKLKLLYPTEILMIILLFLEAWYVEWIKITLSGGRMFFCPVEKWFDSGPDAGPGKPSWTIDCHKSGRQVIYYKASKQAKIKGNRSFITDESLKE